VRWNGAAKEEYRGPRVGAVSVPGTYTARITIGARTFSRSFRIEPDPRARFTAAGYRTAYAFSKRHLEEYSRLNAALNRLDAYAASAAQRTKDASPELAAALEGVRAKALALRGRLTADFANDEDFIGRPGRIREDMSGLFFGSGSPPAAATLAYAARVDGRFVAVMRDLAAFEAGDVARTDALLRAAGKPVLSRSGAKRADVLGESDAGSEDD
jgi:hypothetical protein